MDKKVRIGKQTKYPGNRNHAKGLRNPQQDARMDFYESVDCDDIQCADNSAEQSKKISVIQGKIDVPCNEVNAKNGESPTHSIGFCRIFF
ncbi:hypothetical protein SDC9_154211 [bioreactor metagenome]|uniref:Uncharacterized protein n=1 Tax=bioreactor metagenome TaxID=1076179 RepID=A0A645F2Y4_9ZZZZ